MSCKKCDAEKRRYVEIRVLKNGFMVQNAGRDLYNSLVFDRMFELTSWLRDNLVDPHDSGD